LSIPCFYGCTDCSDRDFQHKYHTNCNVKTAISDLVGGAGPSIDTLLELNTVLAQADSDLSTTLTTLIGTKAPLANPTFTGTVGGVTKAMVGLSNADNTTDAGKPVSTAQQTALDLKAPLLNPTFTGTVFPMRITRQMQENQFLLPNKLHWT
jgi:hypothetical protein